MHCRHPIRQQVLTVQSRMYTTVPLSLLTLHLHLTFRDARALEQLDHGAPNTSTQPTFRMTSNVQLPKLRYPTSAPPPPAATTTTTTTPTTSIHEYLPVPSVNSSTLLHDTSKTSISPDTTPLPPYSPIQPCVDINQVCSRHLGMDDRRCVEQCSIHHRSPLVIATILTTPSSSASCLFSPGLDNRSLGNVLLYVKTWIGVEIRIGDRDRKLTGNSSWTTPHTQHKVYYHLLECFRNTN